MEEVPVTRDLTFEIVRADQPYWGLPKDPDTLLGWYVADYTSLAKAQTILLSDTCIGEPSLEEVVKLISHEYLHYILHKEVSYQACTDLDNIVEDANFIVNREENESEDDREMLARWEIEQELDRI